MIELEGTREKLDKEKIAFKMVSFHKKLKYQFFISFKTVFGIFNIWLKNFCGLADG